MFCFVNQRQTVSKNIWALCIFVFANWALIDGKYFVVRTDVDENFSGTHTKNLQSQTGSTKLRLVLRILRVNAFLTNRVKWKQNLFIQFLYF